MISRLNTPLLKVWDLPLIAYYSLSFITINVQSYFPYILFNVYNVLIYNRVALHSLKFTGRVLAPCIEELNWREWTFLTIFLFHIKIFLFIYLVSLTRVKLLWVSLPIFFYWDGLSAVFILKMANWRDFFQVYNMSRVCGKVSGWYKVKLSNALLR